MGKLRTYNSPVLWVSFRFKNPWAPRKRTPPDDERCPATTTKGARCKQPRRWLGPHRGRGDYCNWHTPKPQQPRRESVPQESPVDSNEDLPDDPAEWLASLVDRGDIKE